MKLSVIVTAYNEENYIKRCLDSLKHQTMNEGLEFIIVDDGSTDLTGSICDEYMREAPSKFKVIHHENQGQGPSRNLGIKTAQGKYIGFLDADDWVDNDMFKSMYEKAEKNDSDIVVCDVNKIFDWENRKTSLHSLSHESNNIDISEYIKHGLNNAYSWNKIYKRSLWEKFTYKSMVYEDLDIILDMLTTCNKISYIQKPFYHYFKHSGTTTTSYKNPRLYDIFTAYEDAMKHSCPKYQDAVAFCIAKRILINMDTPGFNYYLADFIDLIKLLRKDFQNSPSVMQDPKIRRILSYTNVSTLPKVIISNLPDNAVTWLSYGNYNRQILVDRANVLQLLTALYEHRGILSLTSRKVMAPFGYLRSLSNFVLLDETGKCLAIGALPKSEFIYELKSKLQKGKLTLDEELTLAFNNCTTWSHYLFNVSKVNISRDDLVVIK